MGCELPAKGSCLSDYTVGLVIGSGLDPEPPTPSPILSFLGLLGVSGALPLPMRLRGSRVA